MSMSDMAIFRRLPAFTRFCSRAQSRNRVRGLLSVLRMFSTERSGSCTHAGQVEISLAHMDAAVSGRQVVAGRTVMDFHAPCSGGTDAQIPELLVMRDIYARTRAILRPQ